MPTTVTITGFKEFEAKLKKLPKKLSDEINGEVKEAAERWANLAKDDAPWDVGFLAGKISASVDLVKKDGELKIESWKVTSASEYSAYMEWGTKSRARVPSELTAYASQFRGGGAKLFGDIGKGFFDSILEWVKRENIKFENSFRWFIRIRFIENEVIFNKLQRIIIYYIGRHASEKWFTKVS